jgi:spermidine synthase
VTRPWQTLEVVERPEGPLALRRRGEGDFSITLATRVLMTSAAHRSELALAEHACAPLAQRRSPRVLIGGLGMGYTLRAALDRLPPDARVLVCEIEGSVLRWCRGPLAGLTGCAVEDPRVEVREVDVAAAIADAAADRVARFDAIALDLFEGPRGTPAERDHPHYGGRALAAARRALRPDGRLAIWSEAPAPGFERLAARSGFEVELRREGRGGRRHVIYRLRPAQRPRSRN